jgi:phosphoenolpyruvate carboxykinase (GTP)
MPRFEDVTWTGLDFSKKRFSGIMDIERNGAIEEATAIKEYFGKLGSHLPPVPEEARRKLQERAEKAPEVWRIADQ